MRASVQTNSRCWRYGETSAHCRQEQKARRTNPIPGVAVLPSAAPFFPRLLDQGHPARFRGTLIKRHCALTPGGNGRTRDQTIREVGRAVPEEAHGLPRDLGALHRNLLAADQTFQCGGNLGTIQAKTGRQHPAQLDDGHQRDKARSLRREGLDKRCRLR